jgi:hypothetical protein
VQVTDGVLDSAPVTITLDVVPNNPAPVIDLGGQGIIDTTAAFEQGEGPVTLAPGLVLNDPESATLTSAQVRILNRLDGAREVLAVTTTGTPIHATFDRSTGVLTLSGKASLATYQSVLDTITYQDTAAPLGPLDRYIAFTVSDGKARSPAAEVDVSMTEVQLAPVLVRQTPLALPDLAPGQLASKPVSVQSLVLGLGHHPIAVDHSGNATAGIVVIGVDNNSGTWQYRTDPNGTWQDFGSPSEQQGVLLFNTPDTAIRFVPNPGAATSTSTLQFRVWDGTGLELPQGGDPDAGGGTVSETTLVDTTVNGGDSPFSAGVATVTIRQR